MQLELNLPDCPTVSSESIWQIKCLKNSPNMNQVGPNTVSNDRPMSDGGQFNERERSMKVVAVHVLAPGNPGLGYGGSARLTDQAVTDCSDFVLLV